MLNEPTNDNDEDTFGRVPTTEERLELAYRMIDAAGASGLKAGLRMAADLVTHQTSRALILVRLNAISADERANGRPAPLPEPPSAA